MDESKRITNDELLDISYRKGFNIIFIEKDYLLTYLLYLIKDVKGIYFKGGTALNKIFLNHARLSEDLDFTLIRDLLAVEKDIKEKLKGTIFDKVSHDKRVDKFVRLVVHYRLFHDEGTIFIDLNERGKLLSKPEKHKVNHFYSRFIPEFSINILGRDELVAEKMAAAIGRNKPRDHYDLYKIISYKMPINLNLVKHKCKDSGVEFDIIKIFNRANKLKRRWDEDVLQLLPAGRAPFTEVMRTLAKHFNLKKEKDKKRMYGKRTK